MSKPKNFLTSPMPKSLKNFNAWAGEISVLHLLLNLEILLKMFISLLKKLSRPNYRTKKERARTLNPCFFVSLTIRILCPIGQASMRKAN